MTIVTGAGLNPFYIMEIVLSAKNGAVIQADFEGLNPFYIMEIVLSIDSEKNTITIEYLS